MDKKDHHIVSHVTGYTRIHVRSCTFWAFPRPASNPAMACQYTTPAKRERVESPMHGFDGGSFGVNIMHYFKFLHSYSARAHNLHLSGWTCVCDSHGFLCVLSYVRKIVGGYGQSYYYHIQGDQMIITPNMSQQHMISRAEIGNGKAQVGGGELWDYQGLPA